MLRYRTQSWPAGTQFLAHDRFLLLPYFVWITPLMGRFHLLLHKKRMFVLKQEAGSNMYLALALWSEEHKETRGPCTLRFQPGLRDGVRASLGANHPDRFWAAPRFACIKISTVT